MEEKDTKELHGFCKRFLYFFVVYNRTIIMLLIPLILSPLVIYWSPVFLTAYLSLVMAGYWIFEVIPLQATGLLPIIYLPAMDIMDTNEVTSEYMTGRIASMIGSLIISTALIHSGLAKRFALYFLHFFTFDLAKTNFLIMLFAALLSIVAPNVVATALLLPIVGELVVAHNELDGNQFSSQLEVVEEIEDQRPSRVAIASYLCLAYGVCIGGIITMASNPLNINFVCIYHVLFPDEINISFLQWSLYAIIPAILLFLITWLWIQVIYLHLGSEDYRTAFTYPDAVVNQFKMQLKTTYTTIPGMSQHEIMVLVLITIMIFVSFLNYPGFVFTRVQQKEDEILVKNPTLIALIIIAMFIIPARFTFHRALCGPSVVPNKAKLLNWDAVHRHVPWSIIFIIGGVMAVMKGCDMSGLYQVLLEYLAEHESDDEIFNRLYIYALFFANILNNASVNTVILTLFGEMAMNNGVHPLKYMLPAAMIMGNAYLFLTSTASSIILYGQKHINSIHTFIGGSFPSLMVVILFVGCFKLYGGVIIPEVDNEYKRKDLNVTEAMENIRNVCYLCGYG